MTESASSRGSLPESRQALTISGGLDVIIARAQSCTS